MEHDKTLSYLDVLNVYLIGGADFAAELDARRAINQGLRLWINSLSSRSP